MLRKVTNRRSIRATIAPSIEERKELGITSTMCLTILNNLRTVVDRHEAEWLAQNS